MHEIFGLPMSTIMVVLLAVLTLFLFAITLIAWRWPVLFKLGVRNIPRRRALSTLIVVGLMLSTLIISAALGVGDTLEYSATSDVNRQLGHVDELVVKSQTVDAGAQSAMTETIDAGTVDLVETTFAGDDSVDGVMPLLDVRVPVINEAAGQVQPSVILTGIDPARLDAFGGLKAANGGTVDLATVGDGQVVVSEKAADALDAQVGDTLTIYHANTPVMLTVADIAANSTLAGRRETAISMVMPLDRLQALTGQEGTLTAVAISNAGAVRDSDGATDAVMAKLAGALKGQQQQEAGFLYLIQGFMGLGLVVGIAAVGVIAFRSVVERRQQIGVLRALGYQRGMVSLSFLIETAFVVGMGVLSGTTLGLVLSRNLFTADDAASTGFTVPWMIIGTILVATIAVTLLMTWMPSRQAARIAPAEALRYE
jgi:putative ABC transport system permease protein